jgi:hypothetical protein
MTTPLIYFLLFAFVTTATAQNCSFCPGDELPLNGDLVIYVDDNIPVTCNNAVEEVRNTDPSECEPYGEAFEFLCGCPGAVPGGSCPGLCEAGSILTKPEEESGVPGFSCYVIDQLLKGTQDDSKCAIFASAENRDICGCAQTCTFCSDGQQPSRVSLPSGNSFPALEFTCFNAINSTHGVEPDCIDQAEAGLSFLCGCPNAELPLDATRCTLCADGNLVDPTLILYNSAYTCESIEFLLSVENQTICDQAHASEEAYLCGCSGMAPLSLSVSILSVLPTVATTFMVTPHPPAKSMKGVGIGGMGGGGMGGMGFGGMGGGMKGRRY